MLKIQSPNQSIKSYKFGDQKKTLQIRNNRNNVCCWLCVCCWLFEFVLQKSLFRDAESRNQGGRLYPIDEISVCLYPDRPDSESENGTESFSFHFLLSLKKSPHRVFAVFTSTDGPKEPGVSKIHDFLPKKAQCFFLVVGLKKP